MSKPITSSTISKEAMSDSSKEQKAPRPTQSSAMNTQPLDTKSTTSAAPSHLSSRTSREVLLSIFDDPREPSNRAMYELARASSKLKEVEARRYTFRNDQAPASNLTANETAVTPPKISFTKKLCEVCGLEHDVPDEFVEKEEWDLHRFGCTVPKGGMKVFKGGEKVDAGGKEGTKSDLDDSGVMVDKDEAEWDMV